MHLLPDWVLLVQGVSEAMSSGAGCGRGGSGAAVG